MIPGISTAANTLTTDQMARVGHSMIRALTSGMEFLRVGPDDARIVLAFKHAGQCIDDEECPEVYQALQTGIYRRYTWTRATGTTHEERGYRWLYFCPATAQDLLAALGADMQAMPGLEIEGMGVDAAWQKIQWDENVERRGRRERRLLQQAQAYRVCSTGLDS